MSLAFFQIFFFFYFFYFILFYFFLMSDFSADLFFRYIPFHTQPFFLNKN